MNYTPIFNFKANNYINAYILNAICASLSAVIAIKLHAYGEKRKNQCKQGMHNHFCSFYKKGLYFRVCCHRHLINHKITSNLLSASFMDHKFEKRCPIYTYRCISVNSN